MCAKSPQWQKGYVRSDNTAWRHMQTNKSVYNPLNKWMRLPIQVSFFYVGMKSDHATVSEFLVFFFCKTEFDMTAVAYFFKDFTMNYKDVAWPGDK